MTTIFWLAFGLVVYTYAVYPLLILLLSSWRRDAGPRTPSEWPPVSVVVPFCNEPERVSEKLATLCALEYPPGQMQIIFVADGEGETAVAVRACEDIDAVVLPERRGKAVALNAGMARAKHPYVLFTDARQRLAPDALRRLVMRIRQPGVGAVSGELVQLDDHDHAHVGLYWRYEKMLRKAESRFSSVPGVSGALYLIKREYCRPLPEDTLLDDFEMPLPVLQAGERVVLETGALVYDQVSADVRVEKARKVRTLTGNYQVVFRHPWLLIPWQNPIWWQFMSHKVARVLVPYALVALLVVPPFLDGVFYRLFWAAEAGLYLLALGNARHWPLCGGRLAATARLFAELNMAAVQGAWHFFRSPVDPRWEKTS